MQEDVARESANTTTLWGVDEDICAFGVVGEESRRLLLFERTSGDDEDEKSDFC